MLPHRNDYEEKSFNQHFFSGPKIEPKVQKNVKFLEDRKPIGPRVQNDDDATAHTRAIKASHDDDDGAAACELCIGDVLLLGVMNESVMDGRNGGKEEAKLLCSKFYLGV